MGMDLGVGEMSGAVLINPPAFDVEDLTLKLDTYIAEATANDHLIDAYRYTLMNNPLSTHALPEPPPTPPGLTPEQHAAHLAIHELVSYEEFQEERTKPGFMQLNAYWGANGKRKFCCELPSSPGQGMRGYINDHLWYSTVQMNDAWLAPVLVEPPNKKRPWWSRFLTKLADLIWGS